MPINESIRLFLQRRKQQEAREIVIRYIDILKSFKGGGFYRHGVNWSDKRETLLKFLDVTAITDWEIVTEDTYEEFCRRNPSKYLEQKERSHLIAFRDYLDWLKEMREKKYHPGRRSHLKRKRNEKNLTR